MCAGADDHGGAGGLGRRTLLAGVVATAGALVAGLRLPVAAAFRAAELGGLEVLPRAAWAGELAPTGPILPEPEVRYLLVHHSVDPGNDYGPDDVAGILRSFFRAHTSARKGWPDLAYNFLIDRFGRVWEGRAGSLEGAVAGDATGGNQGFDQLCCFIGNHQESEPSPEAFAAMARLLGALAGRYGVPLGADATAVFTSRGSNRHPRGTRVTTPTIAGHRDMSLTLCPGDRVAARLPELRLQAATTTTPAPTPTPSTISEPAGSPATTTPAAPAASSGSTTTSTTTSTTAPVRGPTATGTGVHPAALVAGGAAATTAAATGAALVRRRSRPPGSDPG